MKFSLHIYSALAGACKYIIGGSKKKINTEDLTGKERIMWVIFLLSAAAFGLVALLILFIGHKIYIRMQRQKEVFDVEKEAYEKIKKEIQEETE